MRTVLPFQPEHLALLALRREQVGEAEHFGMVPGQLAEHGPAFTAAETDEAGHVVRVLCCAGLAEMLPGRALAWGSFGGDLCAGEWKFVTAAIRGVLGGCGYQRIELAARVGFAAAHRYAEALGFDMDSVIYARRGGE